MNNTFHPSNSKMYQKELQCNEPPLQWTHFPNPFTNLGFHCKMKGLLLLPHLTLIGGKLMQINGIIPVTRLHSIHQIIVWEQHDGVWGLPRRHIIWERKKQWGTVVSGKGARLSTWSGSHLSVTANHQTHCQRAANVLPMRWFIFANAPANAFFLNAFSLCYSFLHLRFFSFVFYQQKQ